MPSLSGWHYTYVRPTQPPEGRELESLQARHFSFLARAKIKSKPSQRAEPQRGGPKSLLSGPSHCFWVPLISDFLTRARSWRRRARPVTKQGCELQYCQQSACGGVGEWLKPAVLKTVIPHRGIGGSNPSSSARP